MFLFALDLDIHNKVEYFEGSEWHEAENFPINVRGNRALQIDPHKIISCGGVTDERQFTDRSANDTLLNFSTKCNAMLN